MIGVALVGLICNPSYGPMLGVALVGLICNVS